MTSVYKDIRNRQGLRKIIEGGGGWRGIKLPRAKEYEKNQGVH